MRTTFIAALLTSLALFGSAAPITGTESSTDVASVGTSSVAAEVPVVAPVAALTEHNHKKDIHLHRRTGKGEGQAHVEYYTDKQKEKHAKAAGLVASGNERQKIIDEGLDRHAQAVQNANDSLRKSVAAKKDGEHEQAKQHKTDHDNHMKEAKSISEGVIKETNKQQQEYDNAGKLITKHNLQRGHADFNHY